MSFGRIPVTALARLTHIVWDKEEAIGAEAAETLRASLVAQGMLDGVGRLLPKFDPKKPDFAIAVPEGVGVSAASVVDLLSSYRIERHIRRERNEGQNRLKKEVQLSPEFQSLWDRIKPRTTYRVEFTTDELVRRAVEAIKRMGAIEGPTIKVIAGTLTVAPGGVSARATSATEEKPSTRVRAIPDVLAYLQNETELTRDTLVRVLKESGRIGELFRDPQRFMDAVSGILKAELHRLLVDGIKYEKLVGPNSEWEMLLFEDEELINFLNAEQVKKSVYEYVVYDSQIEREFARGLDAREDIKLFVKLPSGFKVDTPIGQYNPDWAIVKYDSETVYLVRETKGTKDFLKLRNSEADKVRCGKAHFEALGVPFSVVVTANEV